MKNNHLLNRDTITLVRESWVSVIPMAPQLANRFYTNLFSLDPTLKPLFQGDIQAQGNKLLRMITVVIDRLDEPDQLTPVLRQLGCRHVAYGVESAHYETMGTALIRTLADALGDDFTDPVRDAWIGFYDLMAGIMKEAAYSDV